MAPLRVLLSEGSSLSARQTLTVLGRAGHHVDVCDPDPRCISRWSRYAHQVLRCPAMGEHPQEFLDFVVRRLEQDGYDAFLPVHEQAYLFARFRDRLPQRVACALAPFAAFERVQGKVAFSALLAELNLPQPETSIVFDAEAFARANLPTYVKTAFGTASGGVWKVEERAQLKELASTLSRIGAWREGVVLQSPEQGALERAQAVFDRGRLVAWHAYRQELAGPGGGDVVKGSCPRARVGEHLARIGSALDWHGAFSLDYLWQVGPELPLYIDANPRLVEPVNASLSGTDLPGLWLRLALGESVETQPPGRSSVRTRMTLMGLMQAVTARGSRSAMIVEGFKMLTGRGLYRGTVEELTPLAEDPLSAVPLLVVTGSLLLQPGNIARLRAKAASRHLLSPLAVRYIHDQ